jgi:acetyl-CoA synthetase
VANAEFLRARDFLLEHRLDYQSAYEQFRWPQLTEFNWALDYFDPMAIGNSRPALRVLDESGRETVRTFAELSARSNQVANYLRRIGVRRYDRILVMLGNEVPLWEVTLAACKIGAVIAPATTLLSVSDLRGRLESGRIRHIIATESQTAKFSEFGESYTRITNGSGLAGWHALSQAENEPESYAPECITSASDPLLL